MAFIQTENRKGVDRNSICPSIKAARTEKFNSWLAANPDIGVEVSFRSLGVYNMNLAEGLTLNLFPTTLKMNLVFMHTAPKKPETITACFKTLEGFLKVLRRMYKQKSSGFSVEEMEKALSGFGEAREPVTHSWENQDD